MKVLRILLIHNQEDIRQFIKRFLQEEGYTVDEAVDEKDGLKKFYSQHYSLVILDVADGKAVCKKIREHLFVPIILLTTEDDDHQSLLGFESGVDDYIIKPFSASEMIARIKAVLKRTTVHNKHPQKPLKVGSLSIYPDSKEVLLNGVEINLTPKEFSLLYYLAKNPGQVLSRQELVNEIWGYEFYTDLRTVDTHIKQIRNKIGEYKKYINTVWGSGYKFKIEEIGQSD